MAHPRRLARPLTGREPLPEDVLAAIDARAAALGLSRSEYLRRRLAAEAAVTATTVTVEDLAELADTFVDVLDPEVMRRAWE